MKEELTHIPWQCSVSKNYWGLQQKVIAGIQHTVYQGITNNRCK